MVRSRLHLLLVAALLGPLLAAPDLRAQSAPAGTPAADAGTVVASGGDVSAGPGVERRVRATGLAAIHDGDEASAFDAARREALRLAVEQGVGVLVSATTKVQNYAVIEDRILSSTRGHVHAFEVVERGRRDADTYAVTVDAVVDLGRLHDDLAALGLAAAGAGAPRVLCAGRVADGTHATPAEAAWSGSALCAELAAMAGVLEVNPEGAPVADSLMAERAEIVVLARVGVEDTQAPVPFSGRRIADSGLQTATAQVAVEVSWTDQATPFCQLQGSGSGAAGGREQARTRAVERAVSSVGETLRQALAEDLRRRAFSQHEVEVVVDGAAGADAARDLARSLSAALAPVESLRPRRIEAQRVVYQVRAPTDAFGLARQLSGRGLPGRQVEIVEVTANRLHLQLADAVALAGGEPRP